MGNIQNPDYETVTAECTHCASLCLFNRIDDIGEPGPYDGRYVPCCECQQQFWIFGDIINPAYDLLIKSATEHFGTKRYMQCVALLTQAWELFFSAYAYSNYLYRPYSGSLHPTDDIEDFSRLSTQLYNATQKFTFFPLRNLLTNTVLRRVHPKTLQESEAAIARIVDENLGDNPAKQEIEKFPDAGIGDLLGQLLQLTIGNLRNDVVHQRAYRPRRTEVEKCLVQEANLLHDLERSLPVRDYDRWRLWHSKNTQQSRS